MNEGARGQSFAGQLQGLTQGGGTTPSFPIFSYGEKKFFLPRGHDLPKYATGEADHGQCT